MWNRVSHVHAGSRLPTTSSGPPPPPQSSHCHYLTSYVHNVHHPPTTPPITPPYRRIINYPPHRATYVMLSFRTTGFNGYAVKYSPFFDSRIACAASSNFGLVGNGRLYILSLTPQGIVAEKWSPTRPPIPLSSANTPVQVRHTRLPFRRSLQRIEREPARSRQRRRLHKAL